MSEGQLFLQVRVIKLFVVFQNKKCKTKIKLPCITMSIEQICSIFVLSLWYFGMVHIYSDICVASFFVKVIYMGKNQEQRFMSDVDTPCVVKPFFSKKQQFYRPLKLHHNTKKYGCLPHKALKCLLLLIFWANYEMTFGGGN